MANVMNPHHAHHLTTPRTLTQKVCIGSGIFFVALGIFGMMNPGLFGMHLSLGHNVIHLVTGALAIWCGYSDEPQKAYRFSLGFGVAYGLLGLFGFVFGEPGFPGVGYREADENLLRIIPNVLEIGTVDHLTNLLVSVVLLLAAYYWTKHQVTFTRTVVDTQVGRSDSERRL